MNGSRNHFFSGARFALYQDRGVHRCDPVHVCEHSPEFRA